MSGTLVDTNIFLDLLTEDEDWADWSASRLKNAAMAGRLLVIDVVYAELSVRFESRSLVDEFLTDFNISLEPVGRDTLFAAAKAFGTYRRAGGTRTSVLPDFFIGAHAAVAGIPLLTRDARRYRSYFPTVALIAP